MTARTCLQRSNGAPHAGNAAGCIGTKSLYSPCGPTENSGLPAGQTLRLLERVHQLPALNNILPDLIALQSLPSSLVAHVLDPQPGENILDMCSSPGEWACALEPAFGNGCQALMSEPFLATHAVSGLLQAGRRSTSLA